MSNLKFKNNPCAEHLDVETADDWCPVCLHEENASLKAEVEKLRGPLDTICSDCGRTLVTTQEEFGNYICPKCALTASQAEVERRGNLLEDVVNELDLSDGAIEKHGPLGTPPAELVKLVLAQKDLKIAMLKQGISDTERGK